MQQLCSPTGIAGTTRRENFAMLPVVDAGSARQRELDAQIAFDPVVDGSNEVHEKGPVGVFVEA